MTKTMRQRLRLGTHASVAATGLATIFAASLTLSLPAYADGDANAKARGPGVRSLSALRKDVTVDYSALDALPAGRLGGRAPRLLIAQNTTAPSFNDAAPIVLRPPPGVAPTLIPPPGIKGGKKLDTSIKLRPPAGVKLAEPKPAEPKAEAPTRTAKVDVTPVPAPKVQAPKAAPTPAPKAAAPAPTPKVEPPKAAPPAAPPPAVKAEASAPAKIETPKPAIITPPPPPAPKTAAAPPAPTPPPAPVNGAPRQLLPDAKPETKVAVIPPAETPKASEPAKPTEASAEAKPEDAKPTETKPTETKPAEMQTAALPPKPTVPDTLTISFAVGVPDVPGSASADLKALAARMKTDAELRVQLLAFASDPEKSVSRSRRLALERAVNVRKQLLAAGIDSTRIEVRALGEQSGDGAPDRVDAITSRR